MAVSKNPALKTDNGPAYISKAFSSFCQEFSIIHVTGLPYNPTGQAIVERANRTLKTTLFKQKGGVCRTVTQSELSQVIFTTNFLQVRDDGTTAAQRLFEPGDPTKSKAKSKPMLLPPPTKALPGTRIMWRDEEGKWHGPVTVRARKQGHLSFHPDDKTEEPEKWLPLHRIRDLD